MRAWLLLLAVLVGGCREAGEEAETPALDTNQIERLSTPVAAQEEDPQAGARLQVLTPQDVVTAGLAGPGCDFRSNNRLLLATGRTASIVRIGGHLVHLVHSSPVGPSGGFFEDRALSISIGRTHVEEASNAATSAPARATITNRRTQAQVELIGVWSCRA